MVGGHAGVYPSSHWEAASSFQGFFFYPCLVWLSLLYYIFFSSPHFYLFCCGDNWAAKADRIKPSCQVGFRTSEVSQEKISGRWAVTGFHSNPGDLQTAPSHHTQTKSPILTLTPQQRNPTASLATQGSDDEEGERENRARNREWRRWGERGCCVSDKTPQAALMKSLSWRWRDCLWNGLLIGGAVVWCSMQAN